MNICFLLYSILLDEEGHIKITGMRGMENLMSRNWGGFLHYGPCTLVFAWKELAYKNSQARKV